MTQPNFTTGRILNSPMHGSGSSDGNCLPSEVQYASQHNTVSTATVSSAQAAVVTNTQPIASAIVTPQTKTQVVDNFLDYHSSNQQQQQQLSRAHHLNHQLQRQRQQQTQHQQYQHNVHSGLANSNPNYFNYYQSSGSSSTSPQPQPQSQQQQSQQTQSQSLMHLQSAVGQPPAYFQENQQPVNLPMVSLINTGSENLNASNSISSNPSNSVLRYDRTQWHSVQSSASIQHGSTNAYWPNHLTTNPTDSLLNHCSSIDSSQYSPLYNSPSSNSQHNSWNSYSSQLNNTHHHPQQQHQLQQQSQLQQQQQNGHINSNSNSQYTNIQNYQQQTSTAPSVLASTATNCLPANQTSGYFGGLLVVDTELGVATSNHIPTTNSSTLCQLSKRSSSSTIGQQRNQSIEINSVSGYLSAENQLTRTGVALSTAQLPASNARPSSSHLNSNQSTTKTTKSSSTASNSSTSNNSSKQQQQQQTSQSRAASVTVTNKPTPNSSGIATSGQPTNLAPCELEDFAERFKQRRIKLGVTQADVGKALATLQLPGVGSLSQSTICRFESLTLSHNNMIALRPILQAWLETAENQSRQSRNQNHHHNHHQQPPSLAQQPPLPQIQAQQAYPSATPEKTHSSMIGLKNNSKTINPNDQDASSKTGPVKTIAPNRSTVNRLPDMKLNTGVQLSQRVSSDQKASEKKPIVQVDDLKPVIDERIKLTVDFHAQQQHKQALISTHIQHSNDEDTKQLYEELIFDDCLYSSDDEQDESSADGETTTTSAASEPNITNLNSNNNNNNNNDIKGKKRKKFDSLSETSDKSSLNRRTSIAARERRLLEAHFAELSRPTSEQLQSIAEKLDMDKNTVRVWFCNQRQKQKRLKYSTIQSNTQQLRKTTVETNITEQTDLNLVANKEVDLSSIFNTNEETTPISGGLKTA